MEEYVTRDNLDAKTDLWLKKIEPYLSHKLEFDFQAGALLVIDMQDFFLDPRSPTFTSGGMAIIPTVKRLIEAFRKGGRPVIFTRHVHHPDGSDAGILGWWWQGMCLEGTPESEVHGDLSPLPGENVIKKHRYSAFYNTDLETILRCREIKDIAISGVMTNLCCESTARDAYFRDYRVFFLADATGTVCEEMHLASLMNLGYGFACVTTAREIMARLKSR